MWNSKYSVIIHQPVALTHMFMITSSDSISAPVALTGDMDNGYGARHCPGPASWNPTKGLNDICGSNAYYYYVEAKARLMFQTQNLDDRNSWLALRSSPGPSIAVSANIIRSPIKQIKRLATPRSRITPHCRTHTLRHLPRALSRNRSSSQ